MKTCPHCISGYPDTLATCPAHGVLLNEIRDLKPGLVIRSTYRIVRKLGQGGMGAVYLAEHLLMGEMRALKFIAPDLAADESFTSRFLREVKSLKRLRHPNVIDCGDLERAEDNSLFFSMEYVEGPALREFLHQAGGQLPVELALEIARGIADGLGAAHRLGMVHRDIKPENILMAHANGHWIPKIADFGLVATQEAGVLRTRTGGSALTMPYAAPEQWLGTRAAELDGRADLYALGGVLYELLAGQTAFGAENYEGWFRQHLSAAVRPPSQYRPELANWPGLDALILWLLEKDREHRPRHVGEFEAALQRIAYVPALQLSPLPVTTAAPAVPVHLPPAPVSIAPQLAQPAPAATSSIPPATQAPATRTTVRPAAPVEAETGATEENPAQTAWQMRGRHLIEIAVVLALLLFGYIGWRRTRPEARILSGHEGVVSWVTYSPDGQKIASVGEDHTIRLWDARSAQPLRVFAKEDQAVHAVAFSPDGFTLAEAGDRPAIVVWDTATGKRLKELSGHEGAVLAVAFSPDGRTLASAGSDHTIRIWDAASSALLYTLPDRSSGVRALAYSPDGQTLATAGNDNSVRLWDVLRGELMRSINGHQEPVSSVAFSPDGRTLASGSWDRSIRIWEISTGEQMRMFSTKDAQVLAVAFSPDGWLLASGNEDKTVTLWNPASGELVRTLSGHTDHVDAVAFSPDGQTLASGSWDKTLRLWDIARIR